MIERIQNWLIDEWRDAWRYWSVQLNGLGVLVSGAWVAVPADLRERFPWGDWLMLFLFAAALIGRFTAQKPKA